MGGLTDDSPRTAQRFAYNFSYKFLMIGGSIRHCHVVVDEVQAFGPDAGPPIKELMNACASAASAASLPRPAASERDLLSQGRVGRTIMCDHTHIGGHSFLDYISFLFSFTRTGHQVLISL